MKNKIIIVFSLTIILISIFSLNTAAFSEKRADFSIIYDNLEIPFQTFSIFVLPGEEIEISTAKEDKDEIYTFENSGGQYLYQQGNTFGWQAPTESGHYELNIKYRGTKERSSEIKLNAFVLYPREEKNGQYMEDFRIGNYPEIPADKKDHYSKPAGFLKIEESMLDLNLTPHFKMVQFLTRQSTELPQFIAIQESLLLKLELFLAEVNKAGYKAETFGIVSLYRSPYFNKKLGNNTDFSRHLYGDAADIYIDNSGNQWMDDLNGDGHSNINDANILYNLAFKFDKKEEYLKLQGGLSSYQGNGVRGPFIHIDTRGFHVSW